MEKVSNHFHQGDAIATLDRWLQEGRRWDYCLTSPPYFQQVDYELIGQYGLEATLELYLLQQVKVFSRILAGLAEGGVCWIIIGDTMNNYSPVRAKHQRRQPGQWRHRRAFQQSYREKEPLRVPFHLAEWLRETGWMLRKDLVWDKGQSGQVGKGDAPGECHESVLMLGKWSRRDRPYLNTFPLKSSVLRHAPAKHPNHPCVFPQSLAAELLETCQQPAATIIDPYLGTGTTARAATPLGHSCLGIDLDLSDAKDIPHA